VRNRCRWAIITGFILFLLLSACAAPSVAGRPTNQPADLPSANLPLADLQTRRLANLRQAAYYYTRYHALVLRQVYPEQSRRAQDRLPDDLLGLKWLTEVCTALEDPSTGPFGEAQDRLRAGAGVGRGRGRAMLWLSEAETVAKLMLEGKNKLLEMMGLRAQRGQVALAGVERYTVVGWACSVHTCNGRGLNHSVGMGGVQWREVRQWWP